MTYHTSDRKRARVIRETGASEFATSKLASISSFFELPVIEADVDPAYNLQSPGHAMQLMGDTPDYVRLPEEAKMVTKFNIGAPAPGTAAGLGIEEILEVALGGKFETPADTVQGAGATTTVIPVTSGAAYEPGSGFGVVIGGVLYTSEVASVSGNNLTLKVALPSAPGADSVIVGAHTFYPAEGHYDSSASLALQALINSTVTDQMWLAMGCQVESLKLETVLGGFNSLAINWMVARATRVSNALADATFNHRHHIIQDSFFRVASIASSTRGNGTPASAFDWDIKLGYQPWKTAHGPNNISGYVRKNEVPFFSGTFTLPVENDDWNELAEAGETSTKQSVMLQMGSIPSLGCTMVSAPQVQITNAKLEPIEGILGQKVSWVAQRDGDTSGGSVTELNQAPLRIHVFRITS